MAMHHRGTNMSMSRPNPGTEKKSPLDIAVLQVLLVLPTHHFGAVRLYSCRRPGLCKVSFIASRPVLE